MADALVKIALEQLKVGIQNEYGLLVGVKKEVENLESTFTAIRAVISDAERRQLKDESVKDWLRKLKDVAYEVDDVIDEWTSTSSFLRDEHNVKVSSLLTSPSRFLISLKLHHRVGRKIREINKRLDQISNEKARYGFEKVTMEEKEKRDTSSLVDNEQGFYGREKEREDVISKLICESSHEKKNVPIISIVGMGGIGKTTLAQIVYNDKSVKNHFALRIWLCVADDFKVVELTKKMVESASGTRYVGPSDLNSMQSYLCELVSTKRFLVVLDDVWNENSEKWEQWSLPLRKGAQGSRIVVTTRIQNVARIMGTTHTYDLQALSEDDCWHVFSSKAFLGRMDEECLEFEEIGRKINRKCDGLPLVAKTIGSIMQSKRRKQDWVSMSESKMWDGQSSPLPAALLISFVNLPSHLKPCLLYCSVFQKDKRIVKIELIKQWIAQGFIMTQGEKGLEDIGGEYFDDLIDRSLFQDVEKDSFENITHCKMHDLVHDLVQLLANEEYFVPDSEGQVLKNPLKVRHVSYISVGKVYSIPDYLNNASNLRTLLSLKLITMTIPQILFEQLTCLRTLDLSGSHIITLPSSIKHMKHLRYFDLSQCEFLCKLPKHLSSLYNLQTLKLNGCWHLCELPEGLIRMTSLQHLEIEGTNELRYTPKGIGEMHSLRTLSRFIVVTEHGYSNIGELKRLNQLQGNLEIRHLEKVASEHEAKSVELAKKQNLQSLTLHCENMKGDEEKIRGIFESLKPSDENLRMLEIRGYYGSKIPSWMHEMSMFTKLIQVHLSNCTSIKQLPSLGMLPSLKDLKILENNEIEQVGHEFIGDDAVAFPKLENLYFEGLHKWIEWEMRSLENEQQIIMPCLHRLHIEKCPKLKSWPELGKLPSLEYLLVIENEVVERVGHELYGHCDGGDDAKRIAFPKLKELYFWKMYELEDWELRVENVQIIMPSLLSLNIWSCPKLKSLPKCHLAKLVTLSILNSNEIIWMSSMSSLSCLANLEKLEIKKTISLPDNGWEQLDSLHTLHIECCDQLESLPTSIGQLKSLQVLKIINCKQLRSLPDELTQLQSLLTLHVSLCDQLEPLPAGIGLLKSLQHLSIAFCKQLRSLPDELTQLQSLLTLEIMGCWQLESLPTSIGQLKSLQKLCIVSCDQLRSLPDDFPQLQSLLTLRICSCNQLEFLPSSIGQLKSLQQLSISNCNKLRSLPDELTQLQSLRTLRIGYCFQLKKVLSHQQKQHFNFWMPSSSVASKVGGGEDWHKIKHIPNIIIDNERIQWMKTEDH